jgi:hypothetical protein
VRRQVRDDHHRAAARNIASAGVAGVVQMAVRDVAERGFEQTDADAAVLDARDPAALLPAAHAALRPGGALAVVVATTNQVSDTLRAMEAHGGWVDVRVEELLRRAYKPIAARLRPDDLMHAHTARAHAPRRPPRCADPRCVGRRSCCLRARHPSPTSCTAGHTPTSSPSADGAAARTTLRSPRTQPRRTRWWMDRYREAEIQHFVSEQVFF